MNTLWSVFAREFQERRALLLASLVAGLLPFPLAYGVQRGSGFTFAESRDAGALLLALAIGLTVAVALGATVLGRDLTDARLGFYYSRPIPSLSLWGGKLLAAYALALSAAGLALLPSTLMGGGVLKIGVLGGPSPHMSLGERTLSGGVVVLCVMAVLILAVPVAHALSIMGRSRSALVLVDLLGLSLVTLAVAAAVRAITSFVGLEALLRLAVSVPVTVLLATLAAGAAQTALGRTDPLRGHRVLSVTLWGALGLFSLVLLVYAGWFAAVAPKDLRWVGWGTASPGGQWVAVSGTLRNRGRYSGAEFLLEPSTGRYVRLGFSRWGTTAQFSSDGRVAVWMEGGSLFSKGTSELVALDLTAREATPRHTGITVPEAVWWFSLSPDGTRVATYSSKDVAVTEVATGKLLASASLGPGDRNRPWLYVLWATADRLLIYDYAESRRVVAGEGGYDILQFDVAAKRLAETGKVAADEWAPRLNPSGDRVLLRRSSGNLWDYLLCDAPSGTMLATLASGLEWPTGEFLRDGRIVLAGRSGSSLKALVYSPEGSPLREIELGNGRGALWGGEPRPGSIILSLLPPGQKGFRNGEAVLVDLDTGSVKRLGEHLLPLGCFGSWRGFQRASSGPACEWFLDEKGSLVHVDLTTAARTVALKGDGHPIWED